MITRLINASLCVVVIVGLFYTARARSQRDVLRSEYDALAAQFGSLDVQDPSKFYLTRLATDHPYHFAWRIYRPDQKILVTESSMMGGSGWTRSSGSAGESMMRLRFRWEDSGTRLYLKHIGGSTSSGIGNGALADFLRSHWDALDVDVAPVGELQVFDPDQVIDLISITIPEALHDEARDAMGRGHENREITRLFQVRMGGETALADDAKELGP